MEENTFEQHEEGKISITNKTVATYTKDSQREMANAMLGEVEAGNESPLHRFIKLRNLRDACVIALERVNGQAIDEASKLAKGGEKILGVHTSIASGRRTWNYSEDKIWAELKEKIKEREEMLKGLKMNVADVSTGEIINMPSVTYSGDTINLKFDK